MQIIVAMALMGPLVAVQEVTRPADAVRLALIDAQNIPEEQRQFTRWVWCHNDTPSPPVVAFALNLAVSRSETIVTPTAINGRLVRVDLWRLAPGAAELAALVQRWELLAASEPYFMVRALVPGAAGKPARTIATFGGHVDLTAGAQLMASSRSSVPIVRADWFVQKVLTTTTGGLYYEFLGVERKPAKGTAQDAFLTKLGVFEATSTRLKGISSAAMFRSGVTSKPRRVDVFRGLAGRSGTGIVSITHDVPDGPIDPASHPVMSLLQLNDAAREIIIERNNGLPAFALFNGKGELQDTVPPDIAADHTIPAPFTRILEPAIGCIRCHGPDSGWKPVRNDLKAMSQIALKAFADARSGKDQRETEDEIKARYNLETRGLDSLDKALSRARFDYESAVSDATGGMTPKEASQAVADVFTAYRYTAVGPKMAMAEVGMQVADDAAGATWLQGNIRAAPLDAGSGEIEDPRIAGLVRGAGLTRADFEAVYADFALRTTIGEQRAREQAEKR